MTIVAMALAIAQFWREIAPLRAEVRRLRQELGYLSVDDENKIYAIQVPVTDPDIHRFRIYLPRNRTFQVNTRLHTIPGRKLNDSRQDFLAKLVKARSGSGSTISSGEHTIDVQLRGDPQRKDHWELGYHIAGHKSGSVGTKMPWRNDRRAWSIGGDVRTEKQLEFDPDQRPRAIRVAAGRGQGIQWRLFYECS